MKRLGKGGQGATWLVASRLSADTGVMKLLHDSRAQSPQARGRMVSEIENLRELSEAGAPVPKILDDNAELVKRRNVPLYFVMEEVRGSTLRQYVASHGPFPPTEAAQLLAGVLSSVRIAHDLGILHRDIKPENVMVTSSNSTAATILLDFGVSFSTTRQRFVTRTLETVGNRFLALPESMSPAGDRRDLRSDLTYVVGIYFFILTGHDPQYLSENSRPPHLRKEWAFFDEATDQRAMQLKSFFDRGFFYDINYRFQSARELESWLHSTLQTDRAAAAHPQHRLSPKTLAYAPAAALLNNFVKFLSSGLTLGVGADLLEWLDKYLEAYLAYCAAAASHRPQPDGRRETARQGKVSDRLRALANSVDHVGRTIPRDLLSEIECQLIADIFGVVVHERVACVRKIDPQCPANNNETLTVFRRHVAAGNYYALWSIIQRTQGLPLEMPPIVYREVPDEGIVCWRCGGFW